jgi:hypothetical protein
LEKYPDRLFSPSYLLIALAILTGLAAAG